MNNVTIFIIFGAIIIAMYFSSNDKTELQELKNFKDSIISVKDKQIDSLQNTIDIQEKYFDLMVKPNM